MPGDAFRLNFDETFPHLTRAPIVESIVHWQARAQAILPPAELQSQLAASLPEFAKCEPIQQLKLQTLISEKLDAEPVIRQQRLGLGFRLTSEDPPYIAQFLRDELVFSRTREYEHWEPFTQAAKRVWRVYKEVLAPCEIQRLSVRFINHLREATPENLGDFLREPPTCPSNLPLREFVYQSTFAVPNLPFGVRVIKLMQPPGVPSCSGLFLNCEVFTTRPLESDEEMEQALVKMRWLKNKFFFSLLKPEAIRIYE